MTRRKSHSVKAYGKKRENDLETREHPTASIKLKNLPLSVTVNDIERHFKQFGKVNNVKLRKRKKEKSTRTGFVHYNDCNAAKIAIEKCSGVDFLGKNIRVKWAKPFPETKTEKRINSKDTKNSCSEDEVNSRKKYEDDSEEQPNSDEASEDEKVIINHHKYDCSSKALKKQEPIEKESSNLHEPRNEKRGRIIVRNLSFKVTEETLMNHFKDFGAVSEVKLLRKNDGKLVGCGFVQFKKKQSAIRAILEKSGKPFLGRPIVCDWALPKEKYLKQVESERNLQVTNETLEDVKIKEEPVSEESDGETSVKMETEIDTVEEEEEEDNKNDIDIEEHDENDDIGKEEEEGSNDDMGDSDDDNENSSSKRRQGAAEEKRPKVISNDVTEGCTIFVKNIPFSATNEDLTNCVKQFGPVHYALICIDKLTEHSKGTGFVKFKKKEDADACLQASGSLTIRDQNIDVLQALPRNDIKSIDERKKEKKVKDSRHLYLVKEGVILAGTPAAIDVSVTDMEKRLKIEQWKTQMLRNLNMFVSNTRLIIYNVPPTWTNHQVLELFKSHAGPGAYIKEARIMRDMRNVDDNGVGKSKEFAFVHFTEHEHALRALRSINNNPSIFTKAKRPIVTFSIENKAIHKIKLKRMQKSRIANAERQSTSNGTDLKHKKFNHKSRNKKHTNEAEMQSNSYSGLEGKPGNKKMRTKFNMKTDAAIHEKNVRKEKQKQKTKIKIQNRNKKSKKLSDPQPKRKRKEENDSFSQLVDKYKTKLISANSQKRWYE